MRLIAGLVSSTYALKTLAILVGILVGSIIGVVEEIVRILSLVILKYFNT